MSAGQIDRGERCVCSSLSSVRVAVPPSLLRRYSALPHTVALHVVALLIAEVVVAPILIGSLRLSSHRSSFVVALARRRLCPTAHGCPVAPLRRSTRWHCHTSHLPSQPPAEDALSAPVLPPTTACSSANDARLSVTSVSPPLAQARVSPRLSASPPRLHHWQRQNRNRLEACNLCNVRNFEGWELVTCVIRHLLDIHRGSLPAAKHLLGIHPVEACRRQSTDWDPGDSKF